MVRVVRYWGGQGDQCDRCSRCGWTTGSLRGPRRPKKFHFLPTMLHCVQNPIFWLFYSAQCHSVKTSKQYHNIVSVHLKRIHKIHVRKYLCSSRWIRDGQR